MSDLPDIPSGSTSGMISWRGLVLRLAGIAFAAFLVHKGWIFWPVVIVLACLGAC